MSQIIGNIVYLAILIGFGALACFAPQTLAGTKGTPEEIARRTQAVKRCGKLSVLIAGLLLTVAAFLT